VPRLLAEETTNAAATVTPSATPAPAHQGHHRRPGAAVEGNVVCAAMGGNLNIAIGEAMTARRGDQRGRQLGVLGRRSGKTSTA
jgi:hypothetical protein